MYFVILFGAGMAGALIKDILKDGYIQLPYSDDGKLFLGVLGSAFIGGCVGLAVDHSFLTAFLSGYVGFSVFENILLKKKLNIVSNFLHKTNGQSLRDNNTSGS